MSDYFIFGGVDTRTFNAAVYRQNVETVGPQLYKVYEVPGRNGDILLPEGRYPNRQERYNILITGTNTVQNMDDLKNALLAITGYARLEDSFDTDVFYSAALLDNFDIVYDRERTAAKCLITFNRKPQRFLKSGENAISFPASDNIINPTLFAAEPLIEFTGTGTFIVGDTFITASNIYGWKYIDCQEKTCYKNDTDCSDRIEFSPNNDYPKLSPGATYIGLVEGGDISSLKITPRWWKL